MSDNQDAGEAAHWRHPLLEVQAIRNLGLEVPPWFVGAGKCAALGLVKCVIDPDIDTEPVQGAFAWRIRREEVMCVVCAADFGGIVGIIEFRGDDRPPADECGSFGNFHAEACGELVWSQGPDGRAVGRILTCN